MTWLLVVFLPGHQRGSITLGARQGDTCCTPAAAEAVARSATADACCEGDASWSEQDKQPSSRDRANCAVCFWGAGLLSTPPLIFDMSFAERAFECARAYHAQVQAIACRLNHFGRDPPTFA